MLRSSLRSSVGLLFGSTQRLGQVLHLAVQEVVLGLILCFSCLDLDLGYIAQTHGLDLGVGVYGPNFWSGLGCGLWPRHLVQIWLWV